MKSSDYTNRRGSGWSFVFRKGVRWESEFVVSARGWFGLGRCSVREHILGYVDAAQKGGERMEMCERENVRKNPK